MLLVRHYREAGYSTVFSPKTGFFARMEDPGKPEPLWSSHGPELMDISITNWCDKGCPFCYRKSTTKGCHMSVADYAAVIKQASAMDVLQVAIGGGNPTQHPEFPEILRVTRENGIIPSYTTNGRGLTDAVVDATRRYCGAVAVSAYEPWAEFESALRTLQQAGIRTNVHYVLSAESLDRAVDWLNAPPRFLSGINALVFLNFKPVSRTNDQTSLTRLKGGNRIREFYQLATGPGLPFRVGFDSCMVAGLAWHSEVNPKTFEACEAGRFSMFVSEEMLAYPCSFMVDGWEGVPVTGDNLLDIWQKHPAFQAVRGKLLGNRCAGCRNASSCMGGCPLFSEINLCDPFLEGARTPNTVPPNRNRVLLTVSPGLGPNYQ